jgi:hypothetical protein
MKKLLSLSLSMALLALAVSPAFAQENVDSVVTVAGDASMILSGEFMGFDHDLTANSQAIGLANDSEQNGQKDGRAPTAFLNDGGFAALAEPAVVTGEDVIEITSSEGQMGFTVAIKAGNLDSVTGSCDAGNHATKALCLAATQVWTPSTIMELAASGADYVDPAQIGKYALRSLVDATIGAGELAVGCALAVNAGVTADTDFTSSEVQVTTGNKTVYSKGNNANGAAAGCSSYTTQVSPSLNLGTGPSGFPAGTFNGTVTYTFTKSQ